MPELPEVETIVRQLQKRVTGRKVKSGRVFRAKAVRGTTPVRFIKMVKGSTIRSVTRRAKYILFRLDNGYTWISHLGMTGKFVVSGAGTGNGDHTRARFSLTGNKDLVYSDLRIFGFMTVIADEEQDAYFSRVGVEPLDEGLNADYLKQAFAKRSIPVKAALLRQDIIAGIGNIYASEALFDAHVSPRRAVKRLTRAQLTGITSSVKKILKKAIQYNGTTILNYRGVDNKTGQFRSMLKVYGREDEPCVLCGTPIQRIIQAQRSTYYCPRCQK